MPNPKDGSVTADVATAVKNAKAGQVKFRNDKGGIIHATIGKSTFEASQLADNLNALIADLLKAKPAAAKGQYVQKVALSSTMGVGVPVDPSTLASAAK
jgi:large subunit ribosomal protein L1